MYYNYPILKNTDDFLRLFKDRLTTYQLLYNLRWKDGFECECGWRKSSTYNGQNVIYCPSCKHKASITAGTLFEKSRIPLIVLLLGLWKFSTFNGITAAKLKSAINLKSYKDAWRWAFNFRTLCNDSSIKLKNQVYFTLVSVGRKIYCQGYKINHHDAYIVLLAESKGMFVDKIVLKHFQGFNPNQDPDPNYVNDLLTDHLTDEVILITHNMFQNEKYNVTRWRCRFIPNQKNPGFGFPAVVKDIVRELVDWIQNRMGDRFWEKHFQSYLDEFSFKYNNIDMLESGQFFYKLLEIALHKKIEPLK